jgi:2-polyprenyl-3-methyl-5-hydroxy-6-metoxy-1,4-benzoquinol methylase
MTGSPNPPKSAKPDYAGHDEVYQKRLGGGATGWNPDPGGYPLREAQVAAIREKGRMPASGSLLELGCGCGNLGLWFASLGYSVHGIDIAPTAVELAQQRARERGLDATFCVGNVVDLSVYSDTTFDLVYDSHLLHCIIGRDRASLFASVRRVLKPSGYFLVSTMCRTEITLGVDGFDPATGYTTHQRDGVTLATRYIGRTDDLLREVQAAGFKVLAHEQIVDPDGHAQVFIELQNQ